ncbi:MAG: polyphenol oxidase [Kordiimonadales bacterium]|nr:MAG: polyphenol oxidase [Kordiimonadales bacterium]
MTILHKSPDFSDIPHGFLSKDGGVSHGIYDGLNCGPGSDDDPANVEENRRIAASLISARRDTPFLTCYQIHSNKVETVESDWADDRPKADAMVTNRHGLILGILTADCTPILFSDTEAGVIGAAHAGWQGALSGVLENTIAAMVNLGARRENIKAAIGPTIQQSSYEVGVDFRAMFLSQHADHDIYFKVGKDAEHVQFDLPGFVERQLAVSEISTVWNCNINTYTSSDHFSYRRTTHRGEIDYGRQVSAIMLP